ncbi:MAG: YkgJ family cysteine cluster protein, partial [Acidobacteriota bacterium]
MFLASPPAGEERLSLQDSFRFACRENLSCFNSCCRNKHLPLTPYDVLRLKNALGLSSDEFLSRHTVYNIDPHSGFPVISIRMEDDEKRTCPFVSPEGCKVYRNHPTACRLYPLARAAGAATAGRERKSFYYMLDIPGCLGSNEAEPRTVD